MLAGKWTYLRALVPEDFPTMYEAEVGSSFRLRGRTPSPTAYGEILWQGVLVQFVVCRKSSKEALGLVTAYGADLGNGHCYVMGFAVGNQPIVGALLMDGFATLITYLFSTWPLRKVYFETDTSIGAFQKVMGGVAHEEARLIGHQYEAGQYIDRVTAAIYREEFLAKWEEYRERWGD